jgi:type IV secretory pathway ATPase VirB11/archaellum biosynthesis ATPase
MEKTNVNMSDSEIKEFIDGCASLRPADLILDDLRWKYLVRSVLRGKNVMMTGPARSGKTKAAIAAARCFFQTRVKIMNEEELNNLKHNRNMFVIEGIRL